MPSLIIAFSKACINMTNADAEVELVILYKELSWNLLSFPPAAKLRCTVSVLAPYKGRLL